MFGAGDEESAKKTSCIPTTMARDGLRKLEDQIGLNPLEFGRLHNSNPGDTEEWDYRGDCVFTGCPPDVARQCDRHSGQQSRGTGRRIWAPENTRQTLFRCDETQGGLRNQRNAHRTAHVRRL